MLQKLLLDIYTPSIQKVIFPPHHFKAPYNVDMRIDAINAHEATKQILRVIFATDYNQSRYKPVQFGYTYVYYSAHAARFFFEAQ